MTEEGQGRGFAASSREGGANGGGGSAPEQGRGARGLEEAKRRGENELGFVGWLSGDEKVRRGDAWWCRRRDGDERREQRRRWS